MLEFSGQGLSCFRGGRVVFAGLSFHLEAGDALVLHGQNGSGKSSLLRIVAGLLLPIEGEIRWSDANSTIEDEPDIHHNRTQYVGHADIIKPVMSVWENIAFWSQLRTPEPEVMGALSAFGLKHLAHVPGQFLSAGQKRRVNLARILAAPANLWLLDEPASALDIDATSLLVEAIANHRKKGGIVIVSTHQDLALSKCQTLLLDDFTVENSDDV